MSVLNTLSGIVRDRNGAALAGAVIWLARCVVDNVRSAAYETSTVTDSSGAFSFTVPQGCRVRFGSDDVSQIDGQNVSVPNTIALNLGVYQADNLSEVAGRDAALAGSVPAAVAAYVRAREYGSGGVRKVVLTLNALPVTLVKATTVSGGGGTQIYTLPEGLLGPIGGSSNLTVSNALDKSFLASVGSAAADTNGSLTSAEISFLPSTAATTSSGAGTCKMKSNSTTPTPGATLDGTTTPIPVFLNSCLNADATGAEALTYTGTITLNLAHHGDN